MAESPVPMSTRRRLARPLPVVAASHPPIPGSGRLHAAGPGCAGLPANGNRKPAK